MSSLEGAGAVTPPTVVASAAAASNVRSQARPAYGWREVSADLAAGHVAGRYGGDHTAYHALATLKAGVEMNVAQTGMKQYETHVKELTALFASPRVRAACASRRRKSGCVRGLLLDAHLSLTCIRFSFCCLPPVAPSSHALR